jgi:FkbM family methyltransferase
MPILDPRTKVAVLRRAQRVSRRLPPVWDRRARETVKVVLDYRGARSAGLRALRFRRLARHSQLLLAPFGDGRLLVDGNDDEIGRVVFMTGGYERIYMRTVVDHLADRGIDVRGTTFLDVGANIGTSTVDALLHFGFVRAVCFEPEPANARLLAMNVTLNDLDDRAEVHVLALSDADGPAVLAGSTANSGDHWIERDGRAGLGHRTCKVEQARLDTLVGDGRVDLDGVGLVWVDTQGHEPFVLAGASGLMSRRVPVVIEYSPAALVAAGGLAVLEAQIRDGYSTVVDVHLLAHGCNDEAVAPASDIGLLAERYRDVDHTDLLLLP